MAKYYLKTKDGKTTAINLDELKVKLFSGEVAPSDVDMKNLIGASKKEKEDLELTLDCVVQTINSRKKTTEEIIAEDAKKRADELVRDSEVGKLQAKRNFLLSKATQSGEDLTAAKEMLDADPTNPDKREYYELCRNEAFNNYTEVYKLDAEIQKKQNPELASSIDETLKKRIKGLQLRLGVSDSIIPAPAPVTSTSSTSTSTTTPSRNTSPNIEQYTGKDGKVVNVCLCYKGEPISEVEAKAATKKFGAKLEDFTFREVSTFRGKIIAGDEVPELKKMISL